MSDYEAMTDDELSAAVAERVMNSVPCDAWKSTNLGSFGGPGWSLTWDTCGHDARCHPRGHAPPFASTGNGMLRVVEQMRERGLYVTIHTHPDTRYHVAFDDPIGSVQSEFPPYEVAETAPRAIAIAALRAVDRA